MPDLFVGSVLGFCLLRAFGTAAHLPWMAAILPVEVRGRFFATDHALTSGLGVGTLLLCAALFARFPGWTAFALVYGLALAGSALAVTSLLRLPSAPAPAPVTLRELPREALRLCTRPGLFRFYLGLALVSWSANAALAPFIAYYLKVEAGVPEQRILTFTAAQFAGQIAGSTSIRAAIDRVPLRRFFQLACLGFVGIALFWLAVVEGAGVSRGSSRSPTSCSAPPPASRTPPTSRCSPSSRRPSAARSRSPSSPRSSASSPASRRSPGAWC